MDVLKQFNSLAEMKDWARAHLDVTEELLDRLAGGELTIRIDLGLADDDNDV